MSERKPGYYWVRLPKHDIWTVGYNIADAWNLGGRAFKTDNLAEIDERRIVREGGRS